MKRPCSATPTASATGRLQPAATMTVTTCVSFEILGRAALCDGPDDARRTVARAAGSGRGRIFGLPAVTPWPAPGAADLTSAS